MRNFTGKVAAQCEFKVGELITLKSGGPEMTVMGTDAQAKVGPSVSVIWFAGVEPKTMAGPECCFKAVFTFAPAADGPQEPMPAWASAAWPPAGADGPQEPMPAKEPTPA